MRVRPAPLLAVVLLAACGGSTTVVHEDAGTVPMVDAGATPVDACAATDVDLVSDASPGTCQLSPADVACTADSDCKVLLRLGCSCYVPAVGVNTSSTAECPPPPCPPSPGEGGCDGTGFIAQDCTMVGSSNLVGARCVEHQCRTFVIIAG
jgi:hypothetical protein